jgi:hypothetical protein
MFSFAEKFPRFACVHDSVCVTTQDGTEYTATLHHDSATRVYDSDCYTEEEVNKWKRDEWFFGGVVISAKRNGWTREHIASLWGCEINLASNEYLNEIANELLNEAHETLAREERGDA